MQEQQAIRRTERGKCQQQVTLSGFVCTDSEFESYIVSPENKLGGKLHCQESLHIFPDKMD